MEEYRSGYPGQIDNENMQDNYRFYIGEIPSKPDGDFIDKIHELWWGDVAKLEIHHGYIQWLFPIREHGMNYESQPLQKHEIEKIKSNPVALQRLKKSYEMMLDFYGCRLKDQETGEIERHPEKWKKQYRNLEQHPHNFLRITRILKCLGEFDLEHYQRQFLEHFIKDIFIPDEDNHVWLSSCQSSCEGYWIGTVKNDLVRADFEEKITKYKEVYSGTKKTHLYNFKHSIKGSTHLDDEDETETENEWDYQMDESEKMKLKEQMLADDNKDIHHDDDEGNEPVGNVVISEKEGEDSKGADNDIEPEEDE
uniref:Opioid growth factor receptor (OGFr) conserved domain-containing protein n=1 Tax=Arcella intermedia TaxID=1963864 RepID=A0A6B2LB66_9EUKA